MLYQELTPGGQFHRHDPRGKAGGGLKKHKKFYEASVRAEAERDTCKKTRDIVVEEEEKIGRGVKIKTNQKAQAPWERGAKESLQRGGVFQKRDFKASQEAEDHEIPPMRKPENQGRLGGALVRVYGRICLFVQSAARGQNLIDKSDGRLSDGKGKKNREIVSSSRFHQSEREKKRGIQYSERIKTRLLDRRRKENTAPTGPRRNRGEKGRSASILEKKKGKKERTHKTVSARIGK